MHVSFLILTDRGALRAGWVTPTLPHRLPRLDFVEDLAFVHPRQHWVEQVSDMAGSYSAVESSGAGTQSGTSQPRRAPSSPSEIHWKIEADRRAIEELASGIIRVLEAQKPESWGLSVPSDIHSQLLERIPPPYRARLLQVVPKNLVRCKQENILHHFGWEPPQRALSGEFA